ncbi:MAG: Flp family type IVb pilin [Oceanicaulis sp.]
MGAPGHADADRPPAGRPAAGRRAARPAGRGEGLRRLRPDRRGSTAIEYALIAALLSVVVISGIAAFGSATGSVWDTSTTRLNGVLNAPDES